MPGKTCYFLLQ
ncbi:hypothetical protein SAMN02746093_00782 [Legionella quinlivanii DSM 21216]|nr:hypothetical protein SAMN02746093_00782 [Legionella quinlivanii DSM 21216]